MIKKILKNKFFILFASFVIIVITARFNPIFTLDDRIVALAVGIEENTSGYQVILESIKPSKQIGEVERFIGVGLSVERAINDIENKSNKKVSFEKTEVVFLDRKLLDKCNLDFLGSDALKRVPEVAVTVVTDSPKAVILGKIGYNLHSSHEIGRFIRKNKQKLDVLEVSFKDFGRDYLSYLGCVTLPYIEYSNTDKDMVEGNKTEGNASSEKDKNNIIVFCNKAVVYSKKSAVDLDYQNFLSYCLLHSNVENNEGNILINQGNNTTNICCNKIRVNKKISAKNNVYLAEYEVYIDYFDNETYIMQSNGDLKKIKIDQTNCKDVENLLKQMLENFINNIVENNVDALHLYDEFITISDDITEDFYTRFNYSVAVKLSKSKTRG